jgi:Arc/MetJ family transcription regulator
MTKRLVDIDDDLLAKARRATGAPTIKATVEIALREVVDHETVLRHVARLRRRGALDLGRIEAARAPRVPDHD